MNDNKENIGSLEIKLTADQCDRINRVSSQVQGERKNDAGMRMIDQ